MTGQIPKELGQLFGLEELCLNNNNLEDNIPSELSKCKKLRCLDLSNNWLTGEIPPQLENCKAGMEELYLQNNALSGPIPKQVGNLYKLRVLKLNNNAKDYGYTYTGFTEIPKELGNLANKLSILHLHNNQIHGTIPKQIDQKPLHQLDLIYGNQNDGGGATGLDAGREKDIKTAMIEIQKCWTDLGGAIEILHGNGGDKDIYLWKGVTVEKDSEGKSIITKIGEDALSKRKMSGC